MLSYLLLTFTNVYSFLILVYILASWVPEVHYKKWYRWIARCVEPYLQFFRRIIPRIGIIDISPIIALFCLEFFSFLILKILRFVILDSSHFHKVVSFL